MAHAHETDTGFVRQTDGFVHGAATDYGAEAIVTVHHGDGSEARCDGDGRLLP
jgi:hypothetical protein